MAFFKLMQIYTFFEIAHSNMRIRYLIFSVIAPYILRLFYDCSTIKTVKQPENNCRGDGESMGRIRVINADV